MIVAVLDKRGAGVEDEVVEVVAGDVPLEVAATAKVAREARIKTLFINIGKGFGEQKSGIRRCFYTASKVKVTQAKRLFFFSLISGN